MNSESAARKSWTDEAPTERRASERVSLDVEVTLTSDSQFFAGLTGDVSEGGLFVQTYKSYAVGSRLIVAFSLPAPAREIRTPGVVRWVRPSTDGTPPGIGIAFETLVAADRASIEAFCRTRPPLYHDVDGE